MRSPRLLRLSFCLLVACALPGRAIAADKPYQTDVPELTVAAGSIGGSWFIITTTFFELFGKNIDGLRYTIIPGGSISNPMAVDQGMAQIAMGYTSMLHSAALGQEPFRAPMEQLRGIANINIAGVVHGIVLEESPIDAYSDIAAKEYPLDVDTGPRGTGGELAASRLLALYGAGYDEIKAWGGSVTHSSYREALDRMKDGHIEAFVNDDIIGQPLFVDIALARDVKFLPMDPEIVDQMVEKFGYAPAVIPAGTYRGQTEEIPSTAQHFAMFATDAMPDDLVYAMTKLIFTNKESLVAAHPMFEALDPEAGPEDIPIPLHEGAKRYYREIGVLE